MASEQMPVRDNKNTKGGKKTSQFESLADKVRDMEVTEAEKGREEDQSRGPPHAVGKFEMSGEEREKPSLEEISKLRATAQQNSMEAIRAAEERYAKAKETAATKLGATAEYGKQKGQQAKETVASAAKTAMDYSAQTAGQAKDYAVQKGAEAKDVTLESGKGAASYAENVGVDMKDKAAAAGWSAAHYSCEKTAEGTKTAARAIQGAAGLAGEKAAVAKDVLADVGYKAMEVAAKPVSAAKEAVVMSTGESIKEYTAKKKEEAERELEAKRSYEEKGESEGQETGKNEAGPATEDNIKEEEVQRGGAENEGRAKGGGVLEAIGETIVEIAKTTKDLVVGQGQTAREDKLAAGYEEYKQGNGNGGGSYGAVGDQSRETHVKN